MHDYRQFLGVGFAAVSGPEALKWIADAARGRSFRYVVTPNVDHLVMLHDKGGEEWRHRYRAAVQRADLVLNDSRILTMLARLDGKGLPTVAGSDLTRDLVEGGGCSGLRIVLVGGSEADAAWLRSALVSCEVLHHSPPMGVRDSARLQHEIAEFIERAAPDLTFLAIGAPQSEMIALRLAERGGARGVALCIGASIEFLSGTQRRAPRWMRLVGLEWAFRLMSDPTRLWRRYLLRGPRIFVIWYRLRGSQPSAA